MSEINDDDWEDDITDSISPHTPGPWMVVTSWYDHMVTGPNGEEIIWQDGPYQTPTIKLSDARLIAAAPEMLELLREIRRSIVACNQSYEGCAVYAHNEDIFALIAKIEGGGK